MKCESIQGNNIRSVYDDGDTYIDLYNDNTMAELIIGTDGQGLGNTLEFFSGDNITNPDLIIWLSKNAELQVPLVKTFDLSTLSLSSGTYIVQVKARATGYSDSNFSNSVSYVVSSVFNNIRIQIKNKGYEDVGYRINGGEWVLAYHYDYTDNTYSNVIKLEIACPNSGGVDDIIISTSGGVTIVELHEPDSTTDNPLDVTQYLQDGCSIEIWNDD